MTVLENSSLTWMAGMNRTVCRICNVGAVLALTAASTNALAQEEVRYSWFEISFNQQDVDRRGSQIFVAPPLIPGDPPIPQLVEVDASDGHGIKFRGSVGTWHNLYAFIDFASSDIDVTAVVTNINTGAVSDEAMDEFDFTLIRGGIGLRFPLSFKTDIYAEVSYDSLDLDFGSFAGEDFDTDAQDVGGSLGIRRMFSDNLELRAYGRYSNVGDVNLNDPAGEFDSDTLFGAGFGYTLVRGLSITGDYESGEFTNWSVGFRLDFSED